ncbi:uncharacterized protein LOC126665173 [Mercurialis annua]|uniref:uncharacterized protein LOC126665173 n=1 Tax=Mercurialis annua TaxID=3986 RepID=UPI0021601A14|nr:uncharacterized protein LOC126665173 [Mercurialis annua]
MDFHSFSRKELQALCKKNKIPANITNIAMADALKALEMVEGLEELLNAPRSESPERTTNAEPRTAIRTSTRRNPTNAEPESSQILTRTRRATRRTGAEEAEQENKDVNLLVTPAVPASRRRVPAASARRKIDAQLLDTVEDVKPVVEEKNDVPPETPAMQSTRRKATVASTRKKMEVQKDVNSVQRAYGTRNSVRLLEKSLGGLSLKEEKTVDAVKIEGLYEDNEQVELKKNVTEGDSWKDESLQDEGEIKHEVYEENITNDDNKVVDSVKVEIGTESCTKSDGHLELNDGGDKYDDNSDELLPLQVETSVKAVDLIDESICENVMISENSETIDNQESDLEPETEKEVIDKEKEAIDNQEPDIITGISETDNQESDLEPETEKEVEAIDDQEPDIITGNSDIDNQESDLEPETEKEVIDNEKEEAIDNQESLNEEVSDNSSHYLVEIPVMESAEEVCVKLVDSLSPNITEVEGEVSVQVMDSTEVVAEEDSDGDDTEEESDGYVSDDSEENENMEVIQTEKSVIRSGLEDKMCDSDVTEAKGSSMAAQASGLVSSPFAANTIQGLFPRPTASAKKQMTNTKIIPTDINKENFLNNGMKVEPKKKTAIDEDISLRKLSKMLREKLQKLEITDKDNEGKNASVLEVGARTALKKLPDNIATAAAEPDLN